MTEKEKALHEKLKPEYMRNRTRIQHFVYATRKRGYQIPDPIEIMGEMPDKITRKTLKQIKAITPETIYEMSLGPDLQNPGKMIPGPEARKQEKTVQALETAYRFARDKKEKKKISDRLDKARVKFFKGDRAKQKGEGDGGKETSTAYKALEYIRQELDVWEPMPFWSVAFTEYKREDASKLRSIIEGAISRDGEEAVGARLEEKHKRVIELTDEILFGSGKTEYDLFTGRQQVNMDLSEIAAIAKGAPLTVEEARALQDEQESQELYN